MNCWFLITVESKDWIYDIGINFRAILLGQWFWEYSHKNSGVDFVENHSGLEFSYVFSATWGRQFCNFGEVDV